MAKKSHNQQQRTKPQALDKPVDTPDAELDRTRTDSSSVTPNRLSRNSALAKVRRGRH